MNNSLSALVLAVARDEPDAFEGLHQCMSERILTFVSRRCQQAQVAEEITQEVMLTLWHRSASFDPRRASAETWIFTIARNRVFSALRRHLVRQQMLPAPRPPLGLEDSLSRRQQGARARRAVARLPSPQREALELAYYTDLTYRESAARQGVSVGTVKSRARLGLRRLRYQLEVG